VDAGGQPWISLEFRLVKTEFGQPRANAILPETWPKRKAATYRPKPFPYQLFPPTTRSRQVGVQGGVPQIQA
jgi:hypothetical protein